MIKTDCCKHFKVVCLKGHIELHCKAGHEILYGKGVAQQVIILCLAVLGKPDCLSYARGEMLTLDDTFKGFSLDEKPGRPRGYVDRKARRGKRHASI